MHLEGTPSDHLPDVLSTGAGSAPFLFVSLSGRDPEGRDAEYLEWHSLDHRPEQHRLPDLRQSLRLVSTPACRAARAASEAAFDSVDHIMNYLFASPEGLPGFYALGAALDKAGRMPHRLPSIGHLTADLQGKLAAPRAVAGADVLPWRPARGVYLIVEEGRASPAELVDVEGVAGVWWYQSAKPTSPAAPDFSDLQVTYCFLDDDPIEVAARLAPTLRARWEGNAVRALLAAPFYSVVPYEWSKYLPG